VQKGEHFNVPLFSNAISHVPTIINNRNRGRWRDGLCDCFRLGFCHPSILNSMFCPLIMLGQIMTRMKLNWLGQPSTQQSEWERTFRTLVYILIAIIVFNLLFGPPPPVTNSDGYVTIIETRPSVVVSLFNIANVVFGMFCLWLTCRVRGNVRSKYNIPESKCLGCEDFCCSFWCNCCTLAHMARQTVDYDLEQSACCTNDGLNPLQNRHAVII